MALLGNAFAVVRSVKEVRAVGEPLYINAPVTFGAGYTVSSGQFIDSTNAAYYLSPAATGNSLLVAGKVGIGTTSPGTSLDVAGNIQLSGAASQTIQFTGGSKILDSSGKLQLQAGGTGTGSTGTGSIYFLDSSGTTRGRFDTAPIFSGATGGTIATASGYTTHTFTTTGTFTFTPNGAGNVEYLVVAGGGGGGGAESGGGGAGGFRTATGFAVTAQAHTVTVGSGGAGKNGNYNGDNGQDSVFSTITSTGGGGGGSRSAAGGSPSNGSAGGSGGGNSINGSTTRSLGTSGQGSNGGLGGTLAGGQAGGGGGGASQIGGDPTSGGTQGGVGGNGTASSISGSSVTYAGGGGGTGNDVTYYPNSGSAGGSGGGGAGVRGGNGTPGTVNSGGGGGGSGTGTGGAGGSGIVIVRYTTPAANNNYGTLYFGATNTSSSDLAEYYISGDDSITAGDVAAISNVKVQMSNENGETEEVTSKGVLRKADKPYDSKLLGIISTNPGVIMGSIDGDTGKEDLPAGRQARRMLALSGRVPVKIAPDSEAIGVGDFLTSSDTHPGMAMKATRAGYTVAKALETWFPCVIASGSEAISDGIATSSATPRNDNCSTTIDAFVTLGYNMGRIELTLDKATTDIKTLQEENKQLQDRVSALEQMLTRLTQYGTNNPAPNQ